MNGKEILHSMMNNRKVKIVILLSIDVFLMAIAYLLAFILRFHSESNSLYVVFSMYKSYKFNILLDISVFTIFMYIFKQYRSIWTLAGIDEFIAGVTSVVCSTLVNIVLSRLSSNGMSIFITILSGIIILIFCNGVRVGWRILRRAIIYTELKNNGIVKNILIVGAGSGGALVLNEYKKNPQFCKRVVALVDDNKQKIGTYVGGVKVLGTRDDIQEIVKEKSIDEIVIAISELENSQLKNIIEKCKDAKAKVKIMPGISEKIGRAHV